MQAASQQSLPAGVSKYAIRCVDNLPTYVRAALPHESVGSFCHRWRVSFGLAYCHLMTVWCIDRGYCIVCSELSRFDQFDQFDTVYGGRVGVRIKVATTMSI